MFYVILYFFLGQLISDQVAEIVSKYNPSGYTTKYDNQLATRSASAAYDDSYLGGLLKIKTVVICSKDDTKPEILHPASNNINETSISFKN